MENGPQMISQNGAERGLQHLKRHPRLRTPTLHRRQLQDTDDRAIHGKRARSCSVSAVSVANSLPPAHHVRASATRFDLKLRIARPSFASHRTSHWWCIPSELRTRRTHCMIVSCHRKGSKYRAAYFLEHGAKASHVCWCP